MRGKRSSAYEKVRGKEKEEVGAARTDEARKCDEGSR